MIHREHKLKFSYKRTQICAELVNYSGDSSIKSETMHPSTAKMVKEFLKQSLYKKEVPD